MKKCGKSCKVEVENYGGRLQTVLWKDKSEWEWVHYEKCIKQ